MARLSEGRVELDPESGAAAGRIVVAAKSLDTDHEGRDKKMHDKVLESARYPDLVFEPLSVSGEVHAEGESRLILEGTFAIHGEGHPLSVDVVVRLQGESLSAETEFEVPYVAWGMNDPSKLVMRVAKEVRVRIEGAGHLTRMADTSGVEE